MAKTLRILERLGWITKPVADLPENRLTASEVDANFLALEDQIDAITGETNLAQGTRTATTVPVTSSTGTDATLEGATGSLAGVMVAADKTKLNGIEAGAQVNVGTNIAQGTRTTTAVPITSSTGTGATLEAASTTLAGVMASADKTKLDGIAAGAQVNVGTDLAQGTRTATTVPVTSSTGTDATLGVATTTLAGVMAAADKTALDAAVPNTRTITAGYAMNGGGALDGDVTLNVTQATKGNIVAGTDVAAAVMPFQLREAAEPLSLSWSSGYTPNFAASRVWNLTLTGNVTMSNPIGQVAGMSGLMIFTQDNTGSRTLSFGADYKFLGGVPVIPSKNNTRFAFSYYTVAVGDILVSYLGEIV